MTLHESELEYRAAGERRAAADAIMGRFWEEVRVALPALAAIVPTDRGLNLMEALPLALPLMAQLQTPEAALAMVDALAHAYARAAGLRLVEE